MSLRGQIRDAVIAALNDAPPTGIPQASMRRYIPGEKLTEPRIAVFFVEEDVTRPGNSRSPIVHRAHSLAIQSMVGVALPEEADDAIEPLLSHIVAVMGNTTLGGLALDVLELGSGWFTQNDAGRFYIVATSRWRIDFQTKRDDLSVPH